MYAVIATGGKQYRVEQGDIVTIERLSGELGDSVNFDQVLALGEGEGLKLGAPTVAGAAVSGKIVGQGRTRKMIIFKFRRRKNYKRKNGHRQYFTRVRIEGITG